MAESDANRRSDASEQIALEIRRHLESSGLQPGDRLGSEPELAATFGVSRPTLREALRLLAGSHLIRATQGRKGGIFVANTPNQGMSRNVSQSVATMLAAESVSVAELLQARLFMEVPLAGVAAEHATDATLAALDQAIADAEPWRPGTEAFNAADARFHRAIAEATGNELLIAFTSWIIDVLQPHLAEQIGPRLGGEEILAQHRAIARAIRRGQPAAAERAMRAHLEHLLDVVAAMGPDGRGDGASAAPSPAD
jgi:GntR family transcriptional repressor for pyruvate dehydrogenase complex